MSTTQAKAKQAELPTQSNGIDWDVVQGTNTEFATQYPRFQWVHGNAQSSGFMKTGGLFVSADNFPGFAGEGFQPETLITREGTEIVGFGAAAAKLAVIRIKQQWIKDETYGKNVPLRHVLAVVKGCDDVINISLKGASKALVFQKAFEAHMTQNVAFANRIRPAGVPSIEPFALWFPVQAAPLQKVSSKDGKSSSTVTPPELIVPEVIDRDYVTTLWVGRENYNKFASIYKDTESWQHKPIWEQQHNDDIDVESPGFTGNNENRITKQQADFIAGLIEAKGLDASEVQEMALAASSGATTNLAMLTRQEADTLIETAKAY